MHVHGLENLKTKRTVQKHDLFRLVLYELEHREKIRPISTYALVGLSLNRCKKSGSHRCHGI